jgi:hypothetical protein
MTGAAPATQPTAMKTAMRKDPAMTATDLHETQTQPEAQAQPESRTASKPAMRKQALLMLASAAVPTVIYLVARHVVHSETIALAIAGGIPAVFSAGLMVTRRKVDFWALLNAAGYLSSCLVSALAHGSALPMKLNDAAVTLVLGLVLLGLVAARRPLPLSKFMKVPHADRRIEMILTAAVGSFLVLQAAISATLALTLSTTAYASDGRLVTYGTLFAAFMVLHSYIRRLRRAPGGMAA